jgi:hypothetical protein
VLEENKVMMYYSTTVNYYDRFHELSMYYKNLIESLNDMLWDTLQYIIYKVYEAQDMELKKKIYSYYSRIPAKYLQIIVYTDEIVIYAPSQLIGRIVGRKGVNVNQLQQTIGRKIRVRKDKNLTDLYASEHPELPSDPEVVKTISQVIALLDDLEKKGVTAEQVLKIRQSMQAPEDYPEGEAQPSSGS